jgi:hypothetical protein
MRKRENIYDSESLRLFRRWNKGLIAGPCISRLGGTAHQIPQFRA